MGTPRHTPVTHVELDHADAILDRQRLHAEFAREFGRRDDPESAMRTAMRDAGRPMVVTALIMAIGFLASGSISTFQPLVHFNMLAATAMLMALAADLTLTPALLLTFDRSGKEKLPRTVES